MTVERATPGEMDWAQLSAAHMARYLVATVYSVGHRALDARHGCSILKSAEASAVVDIDDAVVGRARQEFAAPCFNFAICHNPVNEGV